MAKQTINIGTSANAGDGDPLRSAFDKINDNFDELYARDVNTDAQTLALVGNTLTITNGNSIELNISPTGDLKGSVFGDDSTVLVDGVNNSINLDGTVKGDIVPDTDVAYDLGSATNRFRDLYLSGSTIDLGGTTLSIVGGELQLGGIKVPTTADVAASIAGAVSAPTGDLTGSVFADDSTLLVDGVNGTIPYSVLDGAPTALSDFSNDLDYASIVGTQIQTNGLPVNTSTAGALTVSGQLTVEESYSATPTTKFFEIETGAGNNRLLRTGVNMSAFAQEFGPEIDLTSYRSSPANGDAGPELVLRASTGASVNDVIATIGTEVTDTTDGAVNSKLSFTTKHNGSYVTPLTITGSTIDFANANVQNFAPGSIYANSGQYLYVVGKHAGGSATNVAFTYDTNINNARQTFYGKTEFANNGQAAIVDMQGADEVYISNPSGAVDLYGTVEFNNGTTTFVAANSVDFLCDVDLNGEVKFAKTTTTGGALSSTATALDVTKTLQVLNSADGSDDWWSLADGTEGQIMHFVPGTGAGTDQHKVTIANWRRWDSGAGVAGEWVVETNLDWLPFKMDFDGTRWTGVATAIFTDGAWQTSNPWID